MCACLIIDCDDMSIVLVTSETDAMLERGSRQRIPGLRNKLRNDRFDACAFRD